MRVLAYIPLGGMVFLELEIVEPAAISVMKVLAQLFIIDKFWGRTSQ